MTATLEEKDGKTRMVVHQFYASKESVDGAIASGMEKGMRETYEQLETLVASVS
ncbi:MAG TPA: SRPBCC domain-containing protein [Polyangiaceae bacterium]|nr:SRPBCC domain-containing protein [Polyangiaceae bacterium]